MKNNKTLIDIKNYVEGKMTSAEKNNFEKLALEDPMLQDAIEGYKNNPEGIIHFNTLKRQSKWGKYAFYASSIIIATLVGIYLPKFTTKDSKENKIVQNISQNQSDTITKEVEILPLELDTLSNLNDAELIEQNTLVNDYKANPKYDKSNYLETPIDTVNQAVENHQIDIIDITPIEFETEKIEVGTKPKKEYPFVYFHDLAVVDYTRFENRTRTVTKTKYVYSGLGANYESEDAKNNMEMTEQHVIVSYMDYLEESMWYFSKARYKNALKRYDVIASQYKNDLNALFYGGLSNYNLGRFNFALNNFESIITIGESPFYEDAMWYKAKTLIKLGQVKKAKNSLNDIINYGGYYTKDAINLLKTL